MKYLIIIAAVSVLASCSTTDSSPSNSEPLSIREVVPNPTGTDAGNEYVVIRNSSSGTVSVSGYSIRSTSGGQAFLLSRFTNEIAAGSSVRIQPDVSAAWLNNGGDAVLLLKNGQEIQRVSWASANEGERFP